MKKLWGMILFSFVASSAVADSPKIALVKKMYKEAKITHDSYAIVKKYANSELLKAFVIAEKVEEICIDADMMFASQDPNYDESVKLSERNGIVIAELPNAQVLYEIQCSSQSCNIDNIDGIKQTLLTCQ